MREKPAVEEEEVGVHVFRHAMEAFDWCVCTRKFSAVWQPFVKSV